MRDVKAQQTRVVTKIRTMKGSKKDLIDLLDGAATKLSKAEKDKLKAIKER